MKRIEVKAFNSLDILTPDDNLQPGLAAVAQYFDPLRCPGGVLAPSYGFKREIWTYTDPNFDATKVRATFTVWGLEFYITATQLNPTWFINTKIWYRDPNNLDPDGSHRGIAILEVPFAGLPNNNQFPMIPTQILVDFNVYTRKTLAQLDREFISVYFAGNINNNQDTRPCRILLSREWQSNSDSYDYTFSKMGMATAELQNTIAATITDSGPNGNAAWGDVYIYYLILEDLAGNWIYSKNNEFQNLQYDTTPGHNFYLTINISAYQISAVHIYRVNKTLAGTVDANELFMLARWRETLINSVGVLTLGETDPTDDNLGDLMPYGQNELQDIGTNINIARECLGFHNGALWGACGNEVYFSQYSLDAPNGNRNLNFPSENRWKFEGVGGIVAIKSLMGRLILFGTQGISSLSGTSLENFYEQKLSSVGILKPRANFAEWINPITEIENKIYFIANDGNPYYMSEYEVFPINSFRLPIKGTTSHVQPGYRREYKLDQIDTARFRTAWIISNGDTVYLLDTVTGRLVEWPIAGVRFIVNQDAYDEVKKLSVDAYPTPSGTAEFDYYRWLNLNGYVEIYSTGLGYQGSDAGRFPGDGTFLQPTAVWKTPRLIFQEDVKISHIVLHWSYKSTYPYGDTDIDVGIRAEQAVVGAIDYYLDDVVSPVYSNAFEFQQINDGQYRDIIKVNARGRKFGFRLRLTAAKYCHLTGYEICFESLGRKTYE